MPDYWFARQCPRALAWVTPETSEVDRVLLGTPRMHAIEYSWLTAMHTVRLSAYRFPASSFRSFGEHGHAVVATEPVEPLGAPEPVGDLLTRTGRNGGEQHARLQRHPAAERAAARITRVMFHVEPSTAAVVRVELSTSADCRLVFSPSSGTIERARFHVKPADEE
ncbi:DUF6886 family protein [Amycolatopsis sp. NEAU-NG30]|uniref:DUF6886 family protein n=1 Tax=Amycolatopsis melonis TaxID=3156488 RepID=A0ABV0LMR0_9PSEU